MASWKHTHGTVYSRKNLTVSTQNASEKHYTIERRKLHTPPTKRYVLFGELSHKMLDVRAAVSSYTQYRAVAGRIYVRNDAFYILHVWAWTVHWIPHARERIWAQIIRTRDWGEGQVRVSSWKRANFIFFELRTTVRVCGPL